MMDHLRSDFQQFESAVDIWEKTSLTQANSEMIRTP
jgi:hypothetical protein